MLPTASCGVSQLDWYVLNTLRVSSNHFLALMKWNQDCEEQVVSLFQNVSRVRLHFATVSSRCYGLVSLSASRLSSDKRAVLPGAHRSPSRLFSRDNGSCQTNAD